MKKSLHKDEQLTSNEFQYSAGNIIVIDLQEMRFIEVSQPILLMLGYTKEELLAEIPGDVVFTNKAILPLFNSIIASKEQHRTVQTVYKRKDNSTVEVEASINCLNLPHQGIYMIVNTAKIDALKIAEDNFPLHATLFNSIPEAVVATDAGFCISHYNTCAQEMFGWKEEEAIGRSARELTGFINPNVTSEDVKKVLLEQDTWKGEVTVHKRNGEFFRSLSF